MPYGLEPKYRYLWPSAHLNTLPHWQAVAEKSIYVQEMPESLDELADESRWPVFFPSPICFVTLNDGTRLALEKVVGASIVNRFPYVLALSFCKQNLSTRHHSRQVFTELLENSGAVAVQFLPPGPSLDCAMEAITAIPENQTHLRIAHSRLSIHQGLTNNAPVFNDAYLVYEASLVKPGHDFQGQQIYSTPWLDVGSHRVYFLEINAIQLRQDIAEGRSQILWRSLPAWTPELDPQITEPIPEPSLQSGRYQKGYTPYYSFPSAGTVAFEANMTADHMAVKYLPALPADQVEVDNDRARWPCFFPSSLGMITTWTAEKMPNLMPCGSTTIISRHPLTMAICVSYAAINERYAPRATLNLLRQTGKFGCGIPFIDEKVVAAIKQAGNVSMNQNPHKVAQTGLVIESADWAPILAALPIHFDCKVIGEVPLGTHIMFLGQVQRIRVRTDVRPDNPLEWYPWAKVMAVNE
ncbi:MAG: flavin reductase family protein [Chloroflexota bacterium]